MCNAHPRSNNAGIIGARALPTDAGRMAAMGMATGMTAAMEMATAGITAAAGTTMGMAAATGMAAGMAVGTAATCTTAAAAVGLATGLVAEVPTAAAVPRRLTLSASSTSTDEERGSSWMRGPRDALGRGLTRKDLGG